MKRHYVRVLNGSVVEGPRIISPAIQDSPNISWSDEQMKLHDYFKVDCDYDSLIEFIDYANPIITENSVSYNRISKSAALILVDIKAMKNKAMRKMAENIIRSKYSEQDQHYVALGIAGNGISASLKSDVGSVYSVLSQAISDINAATNPQAANAVNPTWPQI
jgi:hypothetical protein